MSEGFVMARVPHGMPGLSGWVEGRPQKSIWTGLKIGGRARTELAAWKCNRCSFVEIYATTDAVAAEKAEERTLAIVVGVIALIATIFAVILLGVRLR